MDMLPVNQYDQFAGQQETAARGVYDFWRNMFEHFNPPAPMIQPQDAMPGFRGAAQESVSDARRLLGGRGIAGLDLNKAFGGVQNQATSRGLMQNQANEQKAEMQNFGTNMDYGSAGYGRMGQLAGTQESINALPTGRFGQGLATSDEINSMWNAYEASKPDLLESILGGLGQLAGTVIPGLGGLGNSDINNSFQNPYGYSDKGPMYLPY